MSNPGEWIDFEELCRRVPGKSARTLRRLYKEDRSISYRQTKRGGRVQFNWRTVQRELAVLGVEGRNAASASLIELPALPPPAPGYAQELAEMRTLLVAIAQKVGVQVGPTQIAG